MIVFRLSMPHRGSWNNKWSGESSEHVIVKRDTQQLKELVGKDFRFRWPDGWEALIEVLHFKSTDKEFKDMLKRNTGFCGYNWMVRSIIENGKIVRS